MKKQVKISKVEPYKDGQVSTITCRGKLIVLPKEISDFHNKHSMFNGILKCVIISLTEGIEIGDKALFNHQVVDVDSDFYVVCQSFIKNHRSCWKIIALEESFSTKHLQAINDGKLSDGDEVLVECEETGFPVIGGNRKFDKSYFHSTGYQTKLVNIKHRAPHIKLFPVKEEEKIYSRNDMLKIYRTTWIGCTGKTPMSDADEQDIIKNFNEEMKLLRR